MFTLNLSISSCVRLSVKTLQFFNDRFMSLEARDKPKLFQIFFYSMYIYIYIYIKV